MNGRGEGSDVLVKEEQRFQVPGSAKKKPPYIWWALRSLWARWRLTFARAVVTPNLGKQICPHELTIVFCPAAGASDKKAPIKKSAPRPPSAMLRWFRFPFGRRAFAGPTLQDGGWGAVFAKRRPEARGLFFRTEWSRPTLACVICNDHFLGTRVSRKVRSICVRQPLCSSPLL